MAEQGSRTKADALTAMENQWRILQEPEAKGMDAGDALKASEAFRKEMRERGLKGFKKGGKVAKTGKAKVHKGEYVIKKAAADKLGPKKLSSLNQANRDKKLLQKTRFR